MWGKKQQKTDPEQERQAFREDPEPTGAQRSWALQGNPIDMTSMKHQLYVEPRHSQSRKTLKAEHRTQKLEADTHTVHQLPGCSKPLVSSSSMRASMTVPTLSQGDWEEYMKQCRSPILEEQQGTVSPTFQVQRNTY